MKYKAKFTGYTPNGLIETVTPDKVYDVDYEKGIQIGRAHV